MSRVKKFRKPGDAARPEMKKKWRLTKEVGWSIFIGAIMILSVLGAFSGDQDYSSRKYGGFKFGIEDGQYSLKIKDKTRLFTFFPTEVETIELPSQAMASIQGTPQILMSFKPEKGEDMAGVDLARFEIANSLSEQGKIVFEGASGLDSRYALPYLNCSNATQYTPMIYFEKAEATGFVYEDYCLRFQSDSQEGFVKLKDRFLYSTYGVIQ